jgi:hypothetical protein
MAERGPPHHERPACVAEKPLHEFALIRTCAQFNLGGGLTVTEEEKALVRVEVEKGGGLFYDWEGNARFLSDTQSYSVVFSPPPASQRGKAWFVGRGDAGTYHVAVATQKAEAGPGGKKSYAVDPEGAYLFFSWEAVFRFIDGRSSEEETKRAREAEAKRRQMGK